jgi:hypothetical protein
VVPRDIRDFRREKRKSDSPAPDPRTIIRGLNSRLTRTTMHDLIELRMVGIGLRLSITLTQLVTTVETDGMRRPVSDGMQQAPQVINAVDFSD